MAYREKFEDFSEKNMISCARALKRTYDCGDNWVILLIDMDEESLYFILPCRLQEKNIVFTVEGEGRSFLCGDKTKFRKQFISITSYFP